MCRACGGSRVSLRVLVIDGFGYVGDGVARYLQVETVAAVVTLAQAALMVLAQGCPDVICVDVSVGQDSVLGLLQRVRTAAATAKLIVFLNAEDSWFVAKLLAVGVQGFVLKSMGHEELAQVFQRVLSGQLSIPRAVYAHWHEGHPLLVREARGRSLELSAEDRCVLLGIIQGTSVRDLARVLACEDSQVQRRVEHFRAQWGCGTVEEWCRLGVMSGVIPPASTAFPEV